MLACGLPCVELASESVVTSYGDSPLSLADGEPIAIARAVEALLDAPDRRAAIAQEGREWVSALTWEHAAEQVEAGLRTALRAVRERSPSASP
jgi:glycosyltransferase involved in cell wall biosynthesis